MRPLRIIIHVAFALFALVAAAALVLYLFPAVYDFNQASLSTVVTVTEAASGKPLAGATVTLHPPDFDFDLERRPPASASVALTDSEGRAAVKGVFGVNSTLLHHVASLQGSTISVTAPGYRYAALPLTEIPEVSWCFFPPVFRSTMVLQKPISSELTGRWCSKIGQMDFGSDSFTLLSINPDGTFAYDIILKERKEPIGRRIHFAEGNWSEYPRHHIHFGCAGHNADFEADYVDGEIKLVGRDSRSEIAGSGYDGVLYRQEEAPWAQVEIREMHAPEASK